MSRFSRHSDDYYQVCHDVCDAARHLRSGIFLQLAQHPASS